MSEYDPSIQETQAMQAWRSLEKLLPINYEVSKYEGWVKPRPDLAIVHTLNPRPRGGTLGNIIRRVLGGSDESYTQAERSVYIGQMPDELGYLTYVYGVNRMPYRLTVTDRIYTPINPVDDETNVIRHTKALFRTHTSGDEYGSVNEDGLIFDLLGTGEEEKPIPKLLRVDYHERDPRSPSDHKYTNEFLGVHDLPRPGYYSDEMRVSAAKVLDVCIADALRSDELK